MSEPYNPFFENDKEVKFFDGGCLPHRHQDGKLQFVTFRLADSLPQSRLKEIKHSKELFEKEHPKPWDRATSIKYWNEVGRLSEKYLHACCGSCCLKDSRVRTILENVIMQNNGVLYTIVAYVIMPNHVHMLIVPHGANKVNELLGGIKRLASLRINRLLGRKGALWQSESYDRIVRSEEDLKYNRNYIKSNPCFLNEDEYSLYLL